MADDIILNPGSGGATIASDDIGGVQHQRVKVGWGPDGTYGDARISHPLPVEVLSALPSIYQFATEAGDGSGSRNANGNYASTLTEFGIVPGPGQIFQVTRLIVTVIDSGSMDSGAYGNDVTLTNGITVQKRTGTINGTSTLIDDITSGEVVLTNTDWGSYCGPQGIGVSAFGQGNEVLLINWGFIAAGVAVTLIGDDSEYLAVRLNDDLSGLIGHYFNLQGYKAA